MFGLNQGQKETLENIEKKKKKIERRTSCDFDKTTGTWDKNPDADDHTKIFPIMRPILNANPALVQNPGYNK